MTSSSVSTDFVSLSRNLTAASSLRLRSENGLKALGCGLGRLRPR